MVIAAHQCLGVAGDADAVDALAHGVHRYQNVGVAAAVAVIHAGEQDGEETLLAFQVRTARLFSGQLFGRKAAFGQAGFRLLRGEVFFLRGFQHRLLNEALGTGKQRHGEEQSAQQDAAQYKLDTFAMFTGFDHDRSNAPW